MRKKRCRNIPVQEAYVFACNILSMQFYINAIVSAYTSNKQNKITAVIVTFFFNTSRYNNYIGRVVKTLISKWSSQNTMEPIYVVCIVSAWFEYINHSEFFYSWSRCNCLTYSNRSSWIMHRTHFIILFAQWDKLVHSHTMRVFCPHCTGQPCPQIVYVPKVSPQHRQMQCAARGSIGAVAWWTAVHCCKVVGTVTFSAKFFLYIE